MALMHNDDVVQARQRKKKEKRKKEKKKVALAFFKFCKFQDTVSHSPGKDPRPPGIVNPPVLLTRLLGIDHPPL